MTTKSYLPKGNLTQEDMKYDFDQHDKGIRILRLKQMFITGLLSIMTLVFLGAGLMWAIRTW